MRFFRMGMRRLGVFRRFRLVALAMMFSGGAMGLCCGFVMLGCFFVHCLGHGRFLYLSPRQVERFFRSLDTGLNLRRKNMFPRVPNPDRPV